MVQKTLNLEIYLVAAVFKKSFRIMGKFITVKGDRSI